MVEHAQDGASDGGDLMPRVAPEDVGMSTSRLARIAPALLRDVGAARIPGAVVGVARAGQIVFLEGVGYRDPINKAPMMPDALFSIASMTKPMVSAVAMQLAEEGAFLLGDPIAEFLPELANLQVLAAPHPACVEFRAPERQPTIQDLLRHTSGMTYAARGDTRAHAAAPGSSMSAASDMSRAEFLSAIAAAPLLFEPGTRWEYGFSTDVLGLLLERVSGQTLDELLAERLWTPLGMTSTAFDVTSDQRPRYALALDRDPLGGAAMTIHHATEQPLQWPSGGAGAVSTAADYLRFLEVIRRQGTFNGARILARKSVEMMLADQLPDPADARIAETMDLAARGYGFGYGFAVRRQAGGSALFGSTRDAYWSGVYGSYFWVDPFEDLTVVFMAAAPGPIRLRYRQLIRALVYQAIDD
ncbi:MAG: serine hydrolase domain-containing protein [Pseudomonadota bacterium]